MSKHKRPVKDHDDVVRTPADDPVDEERTLGELIAENLPINVVKQDAPPEPMAEDPEREERRAKALAATAEEANADKAEVRRRDVTNMAAQFGAPASLATWLLERGYTVEEAYRVYDSFGRAAVPGVQGGHWISPDGTGFGDIRVAPKAGGVEVGPDGQPVSQPLKEGETEPKPIEDKPADEPPVLDLDE